MNIEQFKWKQFPFEHKEFSIFIHSITYSKFIDEFLFLFPPLEIFKDLDLYTLSNKTNKIIILDLDKIEYNFMTNYYITKLFNNNNYIIGYSIKDEFEYPNFLITRFQHYILQYKNINKLLKYKNKTFNSTMDSDIYLYMDNYGIESDLKLYIKN